MIAMFDGIFAPPGRIFLRPKLKKLPGGFVSNPFERILSDSEFDDGDFWVPRPLALRWFEARGIAPPPVAPGARREPRATPPAVLWPAAAPADAAALHPLQSLHDESEPLINDHFGLLHLGLKALVGAPTHALRALGEDRCHARFATEVHADSVRLAQCAIAAILALR
ncbi:MAG: hypothetical protein ACREFQ_05330 [Stellaceae bacterium]